MDSRTKEPDNEDDARGRGKPSDSFTIQAGHKVGLQMMATRLDENGDPTGEAWCLPVIEDSWTEHQLIAFVKEHGAYIGPGGVMFDKQAEQDAKDELARKQLSRGEKVTCEVCGAATFGLPTGGLPGSLYDEICKPDAAGRVFIDREHRPECVAVCCEAACRNVWDSRWGDALRAAYGDPGT